MRIGVPIWGDRVSPVLDAAERLVVIEAGEGSRAERREVSLKGRAVVSRAAAISELKLDVLICGAVSRPLSEMLAGGGVTVVPWISGKVEDVLDAFAGGELKEPRFLMPGCCWGHGRGGHGRRGSGRRRRGRR